MTSWGFLRISCSQESGSGIRVFFAKENTLAETGLRVMCVMKIKIATYSNGDFPLLEKEKEGGSHQL